MTQNMRSVARVRCLYASMLFILSLLAPARAQTSPPVPVVLISVDGLKPDYVLEADRHKLKIPNLRRLVKEGAYATGVRGVLPTVTYPSHTTLVTGVSPLRHGVLNNLPFDPLSQNLGGWYWYAEDIKVQTLWDSAARAKIPTASVDWPATVGANITYNIPQYWRARTPDDRKLLRALSTEGLLTEAEKAIGAYAEGDNYLVGGDSRRAAFAVYLLENKKPRFMTAYFGAFDHEQHEYGPNSPEALAVLEKIDPFIGQIRAAAEKTGGGRAVLCVVSDHGFMRVNQRLNLNSALRQGGLLQLVENGKVKSWRAYAWGAGGSAAIMLNNPGDEEARRKAGEILTRLAGDVKMGIAKVLDNAEARREGGYPEAAFVVTMKEGYAIGGNLGDDELLSPANGGGHGYAPGEIKMHSSFFIVGPGIAAGRNLRNIDMRDVAPTLAALLGVSLETAEGRNLAPQLTESKTSANATPK